MSIKSRLLEYIRYINIPVKRFEEESGLSNGYVSSMRKSIGLEKLENILKAFPDLNREWLLYGEGEMLKTDMVNEPQAEYYTEKSPKNMEGLTVSLLIEQNNKLIEENTTALKVAEESAVAQQKALDIISQTRSEVKEQMSFNNSIMQELLQLLKDKKRVAASTNNALPKAAQG